MRVMKLTFLALLTAGLCISSKAGKKQASGGTQVVVLWRDPADITSRDLFYGPGGKQHEPRGPFTFVKEDLDGSNPKFVVRDPDGVKWKVKLGMEARPETAASRIAWECNTCGSRSV